MKQKRIALCTAIALGVNIMNGVYAFSDFDKNHWAYNNVVEMQEKGIVSGYNDGTFKPDNSLTREQFVIMLVNALKLKNNNKGNFTDIDNRWSTEYIKTAGYCLVDDGEKTFNPEENRNKQGMRTGNK